VFLTPSHQYPTGVPLHPRRRQAPGAWARSTDGLIVEDDYDGEFRYDRQPTVPTPLQLRKPAGQSSEKPRSSAMRHGQPGPVLGDLDHSSRTTSANDVQRRRKPA
jgi:DNA-binding transcriptional MocR family regulator